MSAAHAARTHAVLTRYSLPFEHKIAPLRRHAMATKREKERNPKKEATLRAAEQEALQKQQQQAQEVLSAGLPGALDIAADEAPGGAALGGTGPGVAAQLRVRCQPCLPANLPASSSYSALCHGA
jgi:hypothetical protein